MNQKGLQTFTMRIVNWDHDLAADARLIIANSFRSRLNAYPNTDHRHYLIVEAEIDGRVTIGACSSISFAHEHPLFSENYLTQPIHTAISEHLDIDSSRAAICEIGSLSTNPHLIPSVKSVVAYFPWFAYRLGYEFALVTVTSYMRESFANSRVNFSALCKADPTKLTAEERARWGSYYDYNPQTGIIDLKRLSFLDQHAVPGAAPGEMLIRLGSFGKVVVA